MLYLRTSMLVVALAILTPHVRAESNVTVVPGDFRAVVSQATARVFPAVVYIKCINESHEQGKKVAQASGGSGVLITEEGEVVTNWHVVDKAQEVRCLLADGQAYYADVLGTDKDTDLALLKLRVEEGALALPVGTIGDSRSLHPGDFVMAMGAPWGLSRSVSIGIISCVDRFLPGHSEYSLWLQTDASISPGNSGGPLVNTAGEVIGINTRAVMSGGDMGFAVPSTTVRFVVDQLRAHGKVNWSWTGLQLQALRDFDRNIYFDATEGVVVAATTPDSPADRAGIRARDRIVRVNGEPITALTEEALPAVRQTLGVLPVDRPATIELIRQSATHTVELTPRTKGATEGDELDLPRWDFTAKAINQFDNPDLYFYRKSGVFIFGVEYPGNASNSGLAEKDIILKIDGQPVASLGDLRTVYDAAIADIDTKYKLVFTVQRGSLTRQVVLDFSRDFERE